LLTKGGYDSLNGVNVDSSVMAQDQIVVSRPPSPTLEQALTTNVPNRSSNAIQQPTTEKYDCILI
jgi:hypothetical protein